METHFKFTKVLMANKGRASTGITRDSEPFNIEFECLRLIAAMVYSSWVLVLNLGILNLMTKKFNLKVSEADTAKVYSSYFWRVLPLIFPSLAFHVFDFFQKWHIPPSPDSNAYSMWSFPLTRFFIELTSSLASFLSPQSRCDTLLGCQQGHTHILLLTLGSVLDNLEFF